jgi:hypothetical protein
MPVEDGAQTPAVRGVERTVEVQLGGLGGIEVRPTRVFLWNGRERTGNERLLALGSAPQSLDLPRRERAVEAGGVRVRTLGNPLVTLALVGVHAARAALRETKT